MVFKLVRVDTDDPRKIQLPVGTHLFGRKVFLDCEDKRVSRSHGQLEVTADTVVLKALHLNPCFFKRKESAETNVNTLKQNCITELSHGDKFGLLPTSFWYELIVCPEIANDAHNNIPNAQENTAANPTESAQDIDAEAAASDTITNGNNDQELDEDDQELMDFDMNETVGNVDRADQSQSLILAEQQQTATSSSDDRLPEAVTSMTDKPPSPPKPANPEPVTPSKRACSSDEAGYDAETPKKVKTEPEDEAGTSHGDGQAGPSGSDTVKVKAEPPASPPQPPGPPAKPPASPAGRERCMYGAACYRKNPQHKAQFSHQHDSDWGAGARPPCPYGAQCRRRDPRHRRDHDHPPGPPPPPQQQQQAHQPGQAQKAPRRRESSSDSSREVSPKPDMNLPAKRPRKTAKRQSWSGSESGNEYDMEDPFMTDGSEDEWQPHSSDLNTQSQSQDI